MNELQAYVTERLRGLIEKRVAEYTCPRCDLIAIETRSGHIMCMFCGDTPPDWPLRDEAMSCRLKGIAASPAPTTPETAPNASERTTGTNDGVVA